jgi:hypothetical protein
LGGLVDPNQTYIGLPIEDEQVIVDGRSQRFDNADYFWIGPIWGIPVYSDIYIIPKCAPQPFFEGR